MIPRSKLARVAHRHHRTFHIAAGRHEAILSNKFTVHVHSDAGYRQVNIDKSMFYRGHVEDEPGSTVLMYVSDGEMEATLYLGHDTYYVERAAPHFGADIDFTHIVYRQSDLIYDFGRLRISLAAMCSVCAQTSRGSRALHSRR